MPSYRITATDPKTGEEREIQVNALDYGDALRTAAKPSKLGGDWNEEGGELSILVERLPPEPPVDVRTVARVMEALRAEQRDRAPGAAPIDVESPRVHVRISQRIERGRLT